MADTNQNPNPQAPKPPDWATANNQDQSPNLDSQTQPPKPITDSNIDLNQNQVNNSNSSTLPPASLPPSTTNPVSDSSPTITHSIDLNPSNPSSNQVPTDTSPSSNTPTQPNSNPSLDTGTNQNLNSDSNPTPEPQNITPPFTSPTDLPTNPLASLNTAGLNSPNQSVEAINTQFNQMDSQPDNQNNSNLANSNQATSDQPANPQSDSPNLPPSNNPPPPPPSFTSNINPAPSQNNSSASVNFNKKSPIKTILTILFLIIFLAGGAYAIINFVLPIFQSTAGSDSTSTQTGNQTPAKSITLTYWGLWEPRSVMQEVFSQFESDNPGVTIRYELQDKDSYRTRLQTAIDTGVGPDIFRMHNTWLPILKDHINPDSNNLINLSEFFPVVSSDLSVGGLTYAVPIGFDSLALYYNPELFEKAGQQPPKTWDQLIEAARAITTKDQDGNIQIAGVGLGDAASIDNFSDILGLMILQQGGDPAKPTSEATRIAVEAYTAFATRPNYNFWSDSLGNSTYAFAQGRVGMIFAPSWRAFEIQEINPSLSFKTTEVPQLGGSKVAWATYWAESVSKHSKNPELAWKLIAFLTKDENLIKMYQAQSQIRSFGEIYPKTELASSLLGDDIISAFVTQGSFAKSWYLSSRTWDDGINDNIIKYYEDAINTILSRASDTPKALTTAETGIERTLSRFGIQ